MPCLQRAVQVLESLQDFDQKRKRNSKFLEDSSLPHSQRGCPLHLCNQLGVSLLQVHHKFKACSEDRFSHSLQEGNYQLGCGCSSQKVSRETYFS